MKKQNLRTLTAIVALAMIIGLSISAFPLGGDIAIGGSVPIVGTQNNHTITINITQKSCYKATTFVWSQQNVSLEYPYYNFSGTLRVHVNFDQTDRTCFPNVLQIVNNGNISGKFNLTIVKYAKIGSYVLNSTYTSTISIFIKHNLQYPAYMGTELKNNTPAGPFNLYNYPEVSYYIGLNYTEPTGLPSSVQSNLNSLGEYIYFSFDFQLAP